MKNQKLTVEEIEKLLLSTGRRKDKAREDAIAIVKSNDENNDRLIDFNEFKAVYYRKLLSENSDVVKQIFGTFDENNDGFIDANEFKAVFKNQPNLNIHALVCFRFFFPFFSFILLFCSKI